MKSLVKLLALGLLILSGIFLSCKKDKVPTVTTLAITNITTTTASAGGEITDEGTSAVLNRGVCWSKEKDPTIEDEITSENFGAGSFTSSLTSLSEATTYYVRAYAGNNTGVGYGAGVAFHTLGRVPLAFTGSATNITATTATLNGTVNANDLSTEVVFECFEDYGCGPSTMIAVHPIPGTITGNTNANVSGNITGLRPTKTYYYYLAASNILGAGRGDIVSFTTDKSYITFNPDLVYDSVADTEGNIYKTIQIGAQTWMAENLKTTKYNDGETIPFVISFRWDTLTSPAYCWYQNNTTDCLGILYNWYTVNTGKLCPTGWHVPTYDQWTALLNLLGDTITAYQKIRETGTMNWDGSWPDVTNSSGFTALPGGMRQKDGPYAYKGKKAFWWSSTTDPDSPAELALVTTIRSGSVIAGEKYNFKYGFSVRCLKD